MRLLITFAQPEQVVEHCPAIIFNGSQRVGSAVMVPLRVNIKSSLKVSGRSLKQNKPIGLNPAHLDNASPDEPLRSQADATGTASVSAVEHWLTDRLESKTLIQKRSRLYKEDFRRGRGGGHRGSSGRGASGSCACGGKSNGGDRRSGHSGLGGLVRLGKQGANTKAGAVLWAPDAGDNALQGAFVN